MLVIDVFDITIKYLASKMINKLQTTLFQH